MRFARASFLFVVSALGNRNLPFALVVLLPYCTAQSAMHAGRLSELHRELAKETLLTHISACALDLLKERFGNREVLEESDNIRKSLMERQNVWVRRFLVARMKPVEQRMRGLVRDDVVRNGAEDLGTRQRGTIVVILSRKIAEQQAHPRAAIKRVLFPHGVRIDSQPLYIGALNDVSVRIAYHPRGPECFPS